MSDDRTNFYHTLQVWEDADPETIRNAYTRLAAEAAGDAERSEALSAAFDVLGSPERRAAYDAERAAAVPALVTAAEDVAAAVADEPRFERDSLVEQMPDFPEPVDGTPPPPPGGVSKPLLAAMLGVVFLALAVSGGLIAFALSRDNGPGYRTDLAEGEYDLASMQLRNADLPQGMILLASAEASNEDWATGFVDEGEDPAPVVRQLEALGRLRGYRAVYSWEDPSRHAGESLFVTSLSTLYTDEQAARESMTGTNYCSVPVDPNDLSGEITEFPLSGLGDNAVGYQIAHPIPIATGVYERFVETVVCFRTGPMLHVVWQSSLSGGVDIGGTYRLAKAMNERVDETFEGKPAELDTPPTG